MSRIIALLTLVLLVSTLAFSQAAPEKNATEDAQKLRKEAVAFLRETLADVNGMRSLENRISFTAEMAALMWFYDESEGRAMYTGAIGDFRDLLARYEGQMNGLGVTLEDADGRPGPMSFLTEPTVKAKVLRKFTVAVGVGQQIAMSLAEHDPELAYRFYFDSISMISNPEFRKQAENGSDYFETQLLGQIADTNASKAAQLAAKSASKGVTYQHIELLKKIHAKDADKGAEFGAALASRLKSTKNFDSSNFYVLKSLIQFGGETLEESKKPSGKRPVYRDSELRDLVEILAQAILNEDPDDHHGSRAEFLEVIHKYAPGRAAQIRAKFKIPANSYASNSAYPMANTMEVPPDFQTSGNSNSNSNAVSRRDRERMENEEREKKLFEDVQKLAEGKLPKEEREKMVAQSRKIIMQVQGRDKKVMALSALAAQVASAGDKELAAEIMKDAEALVNPAPKNYQDYLLSWMLATGYASSNPDKAFPILEETIGRANETLAAFVKIGEFIDVAEEMVVDGEVQVGAFGGGMIRGMTRELNIADGTIVVLAKADFTKTKALTNRFDRAEIRVLAKMMVLRAVLKPQDVAKPEDKPDIPMDAVTDK